MKHLLLLTFFFLLACATERAPDRALTEAIQADLLAFDPKDPVHILSGDLMESELVLFGETHYVQEHQDFIVALLPSLHALGYRIIFDEQFHCFNWMIDDYINGLRTDLPDFLKFFNETLLEGIKDFNLSVDSSQRFHCVYMDLNHWESNFKTSLEEIEDLIGTQAVFEPIKAAKVDSEAYTLALRELQNHIEVDRAHYTDIWGAQWVDRILDILPVEIESSTFRIHRDFEQRESVMYANIQKSFDAFPQTKYLINTGMAHAQKQVFMSGDINRIGQRLHSDRAKVFTIAFVGRRGISKRHFSDTQSFSFDLVEDADADDVIRVVDEWAMEHTAYLPLEREIYSSQQIKISYFSEGTIKAPVGKQFDAILTYPEITTLKSMDIYDWQ